MSLHHEAGDICPLCESKLLDAHPDIVGWFHKVKKRHPEAHTSWTYRGKEEQDRFFRDGLTLVMWPDSPHNKKPSAAIDVFILNKDGVALFPFKFYEMLHAEIESDGDKILWGEVQAPDRRKPLPTQC